MPRNRLSLFLKKLFCPCAKVFANFFFFSFPADQAQVVYFCYSLYKNIPVKKHIYTGCF
uniref:Uncharacterized protein n=1 Tax=Anguilla anguilla TaxID=7936 RepID=A0A0E9VZR4_ANGAN